MKEHLPDSHQDVYSKTIFGFWVYLLTDFMMFATFFATYLVLQNNTFGGPPAKELFHLPSTLVQTLILLTCSFMSGLGGVFAHRKKKTQVIVFFVLTFLLGLGFMSMQFAEYRQLIASGNSWERSAFLSAYFTLTGMLSLHLVFALLFVIVLLIPIFKDGIDEVSIKRLSCLKMLFQFINIVWVFIFTIVYLIGAN
jgi:cytochrome o ubiquinol oxidase subunit 3